MGPEIIIALGGLGLAATTALWKIAAGLGSFEARTSEILRGIQAMLADHETRIRSVERRSEHYESDQ